MNWDTGGTTTVAVCSICGGGPNWHFSTCSMLAETEKRGLERIAAALEHIAYC